MAGLLAKVSGGGVAIIDAPNDRPRRQPPSFWSLHPTSAVSALCLLPSPSDCSEGKQCTVTCLFTQLQSLGPAKAGRQSVANRSSCQCRPRYSVPYSLILLLSLRPINRAYFVWQFEKWLLLGGGDSPAERWCTSTESAGKHCKFPCLWVLSLVNAHTRWLMLDNGTACVLVACCQWIIERYICRQTSNRDHLVKLSAVTIDGVAEEDAWWGESSVPERVVKQCRELLAALTVPPIVDS